MEIIPCQLVNWIGRLEITVTIDALDVDKTEKTVQGFAFIFFIKIFD